MLTSATASAVRKPSHGPPCDADVAARRPIRRCRSGARMRPPIRTLGTVVATNLLMDLSSTFLRGSLEATSVRA